MAVTIKRITLWRSEIENRAGELARILEPLASAGADLQVAMGYRYPGNQSKAAIEVYPVAGKKVAAAAASAGLAASAIPALLVEGDNRAGRGAALARALGDAGINIDFLVAQVVGKKYSAILGFETDADTRKAATVIKKAMAKKK